MSIFTDSQKGTSQKERDAATKQATLADDFHSDLQTTFANQQNILQGLQKSLTNYMQAGPSQFGFSPQELSALNTLAINQSAKSYQAQRAAIGAAAAAQGGGAVLPSGANAGAVARAAQNAEEQKSNALLGIQEAGYQQGNKNWQTSVAGLEDVARQENPTQFGQLANEANKSSFEMQDTINKENQAANPWTQVGGLVGSLAGTALNFVAPGAGSAVKGIVGKLNPAFAATRPGPEPAPFSGDFMSSLSGNPIPDTSIFGK